MKAIDLYEQLEKDFIKPGVSDEWLEYLEEIKSFLSKNFLEKEMGIMCNFAQEINKVFTAVFPSEKVLNKILESGITDALVFLHHAATWDIRNAPDVFYNVSVKTLTKLKQQNISLFVYHTPLDDFGPYSTSVSFANKLGLTNLQAYGEYYGTLAGVIGETKFVNTKEIHEHVEKIVGHKCSLYKYGTKQINNGKVGLVAGGGSEIFLIKDLIDQSINTFITGITINNYHSAQFHEFVQKHKINIIGSTHYSSEQFAMISIIKYFKKLGLESEFIPDDPVMEDM